MLKIDARNFGPVCAPRKDYYGTLHVLHVATKQHTKCSCWPIVLRITYGIAAEPNCRKFRIWNHHGHETTLSMAIPDKGNMSVTETCALHNKTCNDFRQK